ncbi:hypothetical protein SAMN05444487_10682 [Marininema mesophilum]|uniref:Uncharacterized protein n=1 Tax=Marininema mesophilum TaxID=1048340 RepID=A0A1H2WD02_9BACL|nr:hypothetical protein [Marininema mesophilum]SDW78144.1 hypothetical protein SAMN05444487_10682 [Marininema mesophilum]
MTDDFSQLTADPAGPALDRIETIQKTMGKSIHAESMICSISAQLATLPNTRELSGIADVLKENPITCNNRLTAQGCIERLVTQDWHETVIIICIKSLYTARDHDRIRRGYMLETQRVAPPAIKATVENWIQWLDNAEGYLQETMVQTQQLIGYRRWHQLTSDPL